ncbi:MAG: TPM domain-containing protein [Lachnospiraceae bacterium]|nr:TPM domain-containing protein [Lachnospiraceae bacterium]
MKMKIHKLQIVLMMVFMCSFPVLGVQAREEDGTGTENMQLTDQAGLFTEKEASEIERQIAALEEKTGWDIMAVTTDDAGGKSATDYMETWFDDYTRKDDGIICGIDMDNREIVIRAFGECRFYITDNRTDKILDAGYEGASDEKYGEGMKGMLREVETAYREENPENNHLYDEDTGEVTDYRKDRWKITKMELLIAVIAAFAAGGITAIAVIGKYRLQFGGYKYSIEKNGSVSLRKEEDHFINQFVTHRHIERDDSDDGDGGISTIHTGAGGRSSSGGSRKF